MANGLHLWPDLLYELICNIWEFFGKKVSVISSFLILYTQFLLLVLLCWHPKDQGFCLQIFKFLSFHSFSFDFLGNDVSFSYTACYLSPLICFLQRSFCFLNPIQVVSTIYFLTPFSVFHGIQRLSFVLLVNPQIMTLHNIMSILKNIIVYFLGSETTSNDNKIKFWYFMH